MPKVSTTGWCGKWPDHLQVDGVTRTLARLLAHLREQGHECIVLGPESGMSYYEVRLPLALYIL